MEIIEIYKGPLKNPNDMESGEVKNAYISWREQRTRCYNKKRAKYKNYGAKGIEVKYSSRQFIGWWLSEIKKFKGINPTISRIDHSKNYEFGNVKIESRSENSIERNNRVESFLKPKKVFLLSDKKEKIALFNSINKAAKFLDLKTINFYSFLKNNKKYKSFYFELGS